MIREVKLTSLADVGNRFGVDASTIYRWIHGATVPKMAMILAFLYARDQRKCWPEFDDSDAIAGNLSGNAPRNGYDVPNA